MIMEESKRFRKYAKIWGAFGWTFIILALLGMLGLVVAFIMLGLGVGRAGLLGVLSGSFGGGAVLCGVLGYLTVKRGEHFSDLALDAEERADSEDSFFVGEGTLASFGEEELVIHGEKDKKICVPYREIRVFSVCVRVKPREKGEWSVLVELPARYLVKKAKKEDPPVLVQTEGKERLYQTLKKRGLELLGEPPANRAKKPEKFTRMRKFELPDRKKRKTKLLLAALGGAVVCGGIGLAFYMLSLGAVVAVIGLYVLGRALVGYAQAKRVFAVYEEGLYLKELSLQDSFFLKWEEIVSLKAAEVEKQPAVRAECLYGAYDFPRPDGAYEYLKEKFPDKCGRSEGETA